VKRADILKLILWLLAGAGAVVTASRLLFGLGATTALTDGFPWGLWKMFNVVACMPLAAGGFVLAGMVYIFHLDRYKPILRATVLLALLGYSSVAASLAIDIGVPWRIWFPIIYRQHHSVLFEVAWCIILYLNLLLVEFSPVVLERLPFGWLLKLIKKLTIPLVIIGIGLSVLHQSSLGTLFLIMSFRLHPLWYSWMLPVLFFVSAIGLGIFVVTGVTLLVTWLYRREPDMKMLSGFARAGSYFMALYLLIRVADITFTGKLRYVFAGDVDSVNYCIEIFLGALLPCVLLQLPRVRSSKAGLAFCSAMVIAGTVLYRMNCAGIATMTTIKAFYFPWWMEFVFTFAMLSAAALVFLFFVEHFSVYPGVGREAEDDAARRFDPLSAGVLGGVWGIGYRGYSFAFVLGAAITFGLLPRDAVHGCRPRPCPVKQSRRMPATKVSGNGVISTPLAPAVSNEGSSAFEVFVIDGNRDGRFVLFDHHAHTEREGKKKSCAVCHHMNMPKDRKTSCWECHKDMYLETDMFDHDYHVERTDGNVGCVKCHKDPSVVKDRQTAVRCEECHKDMQVAGTMVEIPRDEAKRYMAAGYKIAMHHLCIRCHEKARGKDKKLPVEMVRCAWCHGAGAETERSRIE